MALVFLETLFPCQGAKDLSSQQLILIMWGKLLSTRTQVKIICKCVCFYSSVRKRQFHGASHSCGQRGCSWDKQVHPLVLVLLLMWREAKMNYEQRQSI